MSIGLVPCICINYWPISIKCVLFGYALISNWKSFGLDFGHIQGDKPSIPSHNFMYIGGFWLECMRVHHSAQCIRRLHKMLQMFQCSQKSCISI